MGGVQHFVCAIDADIIDAGILKRWSQGYEIVGNTWKNEVYQVY